MRAAAARTLLAVWAQGRSLTEALATEARTLAAADRRDDALLRELASGSIRLLPRLQALAAILLARPLPPGDRIVQALLLVGLYQLIATRIPPHAAVAATVAAAHDLDGRRRPWGPGLVNATLRRFQRERDALLTEVLRDPAARWLLPSWLHARLQAAWPAHWQDLIDASNGRAPMVLRINRRRVDLAAYTATLATAGLTARPLPGLPQALQLDDPVAVADLPGYAQGLVSVQDSSAQWAAHLLDPQPGERVLDACAAPGGKTAHLIEYINGAALVTAVDRDAARLDSLRTGLDRLGHQARVLLGDATAPAADWPGAPYQRILLDAPCSATGVIRRHPDIKLLRRPADIPSLVATQAAMLAALWPLLAPGGRLLYATCALLPEENEQQVRAFLAAHPEASACPLGPLPGGLPRDPGWQLLPRPDGGDGFYYALLEKQAG
ncbi:MAG: 16S rRNA (cytosine(967)-C(5))-methyltransferase RsmB [Chromatiaceae bacterium]|nr:MAG: 16S rRNA (cytosine(967)-C(5))-methyltransferase RsmB [Chromatiaceae bacterium]